MISNFQDMIKEIQKQKTQGIFGLTALQGISAAIEKQNKVQFSLSALSGVTDFTRTISQQMKALNTTSKIIGNNLQSPLGAIQFPKYHSALFGLTSMLSDLSKTNQLLSDNLSGLATSQLIISNSMASIAKALNQSHLNSFNSLDIALQGITKSFLKDVPITKNWEDISVAEEANETIANIADDLLCNNVQVTVEVLDNLRQSIITGLYGLLKKTKTEKARQFIFELITIISFLLIFYNPFEIKTDKTNTEVIEEVKKEIIKANEELLNKFELKLQRLSKTRIATTNVNLRKSEKKNSKVIGQIKVGQRVTVIEIRHKHLLISYIDKDTGEPKSGFVFKKYFEIEK